MNRKIGFFVLPVLALALAFSVLSPCLPPNGYRLDDFTEGSLSVDNAGNLYFVWADFRNGGGICVGSAATATPPCNNDVFYTFSTDGGASWRPPSTSHR